MLTTRSRQELLSVSVAFICLLVLLVRGIQILVYRGEIIARSLIPLVFHVPFVHFHSKFLDFIYIKIGDRLLILSLS